MQQANIWVGTSGWVYKEWAGAFYPRGWPKQREFEYYLRHFPTVEINATFYRLPTRSMVRGWHDRAPEGFVYAVKGSRYLTHLKRLKDTSHGLQKYLRRIAPLAEHTGPVLWQLPPTFPKSDKTFARLERFLSRLPRRGLRHAIEFRHPSWLDEQTYALLRRRGTASVWVSSLQMPVDHTVTADFVYLRFHGLEGGAYHDYTDAELAPWCRALTRVSRRGIPAYVYFNNDLNTRAPQNAERLMEMLGERALPPIPQSPSAPAITPAAAIEPSRPSRRRAPRATATQRRPARSRRSPTPSHAAVLRSRTPHGRPVFAQPSVRIPSPATRRARVPAASPRLHPA
ncbi:DUF72 domain-containing protein [Opitutus sp. ER46]|uniref:DUF72 domain-containing protein n=1 Tax=Opitutus sp. ER46 TaxID=2161864 RepID=UPI000D314F49|nr:DUF72 domain-containing protein [Opitutus sp. ER46]PTX94325.1 DUF72 domain-containing protein [Opitutus sp. ER46]